MRDLDLAIRALREAVETNKKQQNLLDVLASHSEAQKEHIEALTKEVREWRKAFRWTTKPEEA